MKNLIISICLLNLLCALPASARPGSNPTTTNTEDSLIIWCSPDLYELANTWINSYAGIHPELPSKLYIVNAGDLGRKLSGSGDIGLITKDFLPESLGESAWRMAVARDVKVPVINPENPFLDEIYSKGISAEKFSSAFSGEAEPTWGTLLGDDKVDNPVNSYCLNAENMHACLAAFVQSDRIINHGKDISDKDELLEMIQRDKYALGFCRLATVLDFENQVIDERVKLVPIDINGNNKVDYFEDIYRNVNDFTRGVWIGKYPREFCGNIYLISGSQPTGDIQLAFLEWVLTEGQQDLNSNGYSELLTNESYRKVQSLYPEKLPVMEDHSTSKRAGRLLLILVMGMTGGIFALMVARYFGLRRQEAGPVPAERNTGFSEDSVWLPAGLFFDKSHTWAFMEKDGSVRIGVDDFLLHLTGRITKVKMKAKDERITKGKSFLSIIQDGKQLEIHSPVSGTVTAYNERLETSSSLLNKSPYSDGWVYTVKPDNWLQDIRSFLMAEKYRGWLKNEFSRLKDFLVTTLRPDPVYASQLIMQEGGEIRENLLEQLGPGEWEEFQSEFINTSY